MCNFSEIKRKLETKGLCFGKGSQRKEYKARMMFAYICKVKTNARLWEIALAIGRTRSATCMMIKQANRMLKEQGFYQEVNDIINEINDEKELEGLGILSQNNYEI